jgi:DNA-binding NarL/FixJ family response regulator
VTGERIRVVIADDHPPVRAGVRAMLGLDGTIDVVAEASTSEEAVRAAVDHQPDVMVVDLRMPGPGGVEVTRDVVRDSPHIAVLILTMVDDGDSVFAAFRAGARGYLLKESGPEELSRAVHAVANGELITSPAIATAVSQFFATSATARSTEAFPGLTPREGEVLDLIAQGRNNAFIARRLDLSPKTVRNHISNIFSKLQVVDRADAIVRAREAGLGTRG